MNIHMHMSVHPHTKWYAHRLFIYGLLYNALHISDYTAQNGNMNDA
jgi:hypothetical protein